MSGVPLSVDPAAAAQVAVVPRRRPLLDSIVAVVLGGYAAAAGLTSSEYPQPGLATGVLMGAAGLVLVVRRSHPVVSFVGSLGLMTLVSLLFGSYQAGSAVLIALVSCYSALAYRVPIRLFGATVLVFTIVEGRGPLPDAIGGMLFVAAACAAAGAGGHLTARLRELTAANVALRELVQLESAATTQAAVDSERARVARELHDILSHSLGVVVLQTSAADHAWNTDPDLARESLQSARATAVEAVDQLRTLLSVVREEDPAATRVPVPGIADLSTLAARTTAAGFRVDVDVVGDPRAVPAAVAASVYRVAQEGIANAMKHSGTRNCRLRLTYQPDSIVVQIDDEGGPTRPAGTGSQLGLTGIRERAALFGGRVEAGPRDPAGWRLQVAFPA